MQSVKIIFVLDVPASVTANIATGPVVCGYCATSTGKASQLHLMPVNGFASQNLRLSHRDNPADTTLLLSWSNRLHWWARSIANLATGYHNTDLTGYD
jgi:hypothetical protein